MINIYKKNSHCSTEAESRHEICINLYKIHNFTKSHQHYTILSDTEHHKNYKCHVIIN